MKPPPDALGRVDLSNATAGAALQRARDWRKAARRAGRRAYLLQCDDCGAIGTARLRHDGRIVSLGMPIADQRHGPPCGGSLSLYDLPKGQHAA